MVCFIKDFLFFQQKGLASVITVKLASEGIGNIPTVQIFIYRRICTVFEGVNNQQGFIIILSQNSLIACWVVIIPCGAFNNCCFAVFNYILDFVVKVIASITLFQYSSFKSKISPLRHSLPRKPAVKL